MDADRYPTGSRVEMYWSKEKEWYAATVLKTRSESHVVDGAKTLCREILCDYDIGDRLQWHSMHVSHVRPCSTPVQADKSGLSDPHAVGSRVEVWWPKDNSWYAATVLKTRASVQRTRTPCREILCEYEIDKALLYHSLNNTRVRAAGARESRFEPRVCGPCL